MIIKINIKILLILLQTYYFTNEILENNTINKKIDVDTNVQKNFNNKQIKQIKKVYIILTNIKSIKKQLYFKRYDLFFHIIFFIIANYFEKINSDYINVKTIFINKPNTFLTNHRIIIFYIVFIVVLINIMYSLYSIFNVYKNMIEKKIFNKKILYFLLLVLGIIDLMLYHYIYKNIIYDPEPCDWRVYCCVNFLIFLINILYIIINECILNYYCFTVKFDDNFDFLFEKNIEIKQKIEHKVDNQNLSDTNDKNNHYEEILLKKDGSNENFEQNL